MNECRESVCRKCGNAFSLLPTQSVHPNCIPATCGMCRSGCKPCRNCGKAFKRSGPGQPALFCSHECRRIYQFEYAERKAKETVIQTYEKTCDDCGEQFSTTRAITKRCKQCRAQRLIDGKSQRTCQQCKQQFRASRAKLCKACRVHADRQRAQRASAKRYREQEQSVSISKTAAVGSIAERLFDIACLRRGWVLLSPVSECNPGFDRTIVRGTEFIRVQVKGLSGTRFGDGDKWQLGGGFERLNINAFDELAIVDVDTGFMWLIPKAAVRRSFFPTDYIEYETHVFS